MSETMAGRPLVEVLIRIGIELEEAAASVEDLHALVEASVKGGASSDTFLRQAQTIDILQQRLVALASFIGQISETTPSSWLIETSDAVNKVKLSRLRERLSQICNAHDAAEHHISGELQMF